MRRERIAGDPEPTYHAAKDGDRAAAVWRRRAGRLDHVRRVLPPISEMFVIEDRYVLFHALHGSHNLIKKTTSRILLLFRVCRNGVPAMFRDTQNAGHWNVILAKRNRLVDRTRDSKSILP